MARMTAEQRFKAIRDYLCLATGLGIFTFQGINNQWNIYAIAACLILVGVPLVNLRTLFPGNTNTPESLPQSPQPELPSSSTPTPPTS